MINKIIIPILLTSSILYSSMYEREFKAIDEDYSNISDTFILTNTDIKVNLMRIQKLIKEDNSPKAELLTNKLLETVTDDYTRGKLLNLYAVILEKTTSIENVIDFIEDNINMKKINNDNIAESYYLLLKNYVLLKNAKQVSIYYGILKEIFKDDIYIVEKADIEYAKFLLEKNNYIKANKLLENVFYHTKFKENAAASSLVLINLYFEEKQISVDLIDKYLSKIYQYNKKFFLDNKLDLFKNLDLFSRLDSIVVQNILVYLFENIQNNSKYSKEWKKIGFILYNKYLQTQNYKEAKTILMTLMDKYTWINRKEVLFIKKNLIYIYELTEIKPVLDYKFHNDKEKVIDFFIKSKDMKSNRKFLLKNYNIYKNIDKEMFNYFYFNKKKMLRHVSKNILDYYIKKSNDIDFNDSLSKKIFLDELLNNIDDYIDEFPLNLRVIFYFITNEYYGLNDTLYKKFINNTNNILNRGLATLFLSKNTDYTLDYLNKMLNSKDLVVEERKYFYITKMNLLFLNKDFKEIQKSFKRKNEFELTTEELIEIYFKYYLIIKNSPSDDSDVEDVLINIINLSSEIKSHNHRPFIDFELSEILLSNQEYNKVLLILDSIPKKHFLSDEYKAHLAYMYAYSYYQVNKLDTAKKHITKCLKIKDDSLWVQSCQFLKNRIYEDINNRSN